MLLAGACTRQDGLTPADRQTVLNWLVCEECIDGERNAVVALGPPAIPILSSVLDSVPAVIVEPARTRLFNRWTPELGPDRDAYVASYVDNIESLARIRAARSLGDLRAEDELRAALDLARQRQYRADVLTEIEGALLSAGDPIAAPFGVRVSPAALTVAVGNTVQPAAFIEDSLSNIVAGTPVWTSSNPTVATVDADGVITGMASGTAIVEAAVGGRSGSTVVTVTPTAPASNILEIVSGNNQSADTGERLPDPVRVRLMTSAGTPISGTEVSWTVLLGNGTVSAATTTTGSDGSTRIEWRLGVAGPQRLEASAPGGPAAPGALGAPGAPGALPVVIRATAND